MNAKQVFACFVVSLLAIIIYLKKTPTHIKNEETQTCYHDLVKKTSLCSFVCPYGEFALPGMLSCHPWLSCLDKITIVSTISNSVVKSVYLAKWSKYDVILSVLSSKIYEDDFKQNIFMMKSLSSSPQVVQLIGLCKNSIVTKYYELGSALNVNYHLKHSMHYYDSIKTRLNLCISYVSAINFLHSSPVGVRVMCDSNSLEKTLSQYLLNENFEILINDLDAIPEVDKISKKGIVCGKRILSGTFVAPEQLWPYPNHEYNPKKMIPYDEKTDIWKIPDVCNWFLGESSNADFVKYKLFSIHKRCKEIDPTKRPNSTHVLKLYQEIFHEL